MTSYPHERDAIDNRERIRLLSTHQIHVFISHSWQYSDHYETLAEWIFGEYWSMGQASLDFRNFSVPKDDPIHHARNESELQAAIYRQIGLSHVVVIPTGMYATYSKWINKEIEGARAKNKPILAVNPWGQERKASIVGAHASRIVGWNKQPIIDGLWSLYRDT